MKVAADKDALTVPELFETLTAAVCSEMVDGKAFGKTYTNRQPLISSVRRNLQRAYITTLIDVTLDATGSWYPQSAKTIIWDELKSLQGRINTLVAGGNAAKLDRYSRTHLEECNMLIEKALEAKFSLE